MGNYKIRKVFLGESDIAKLVLVGYKEQEGVVCQMLSFLGDDSYSAYILYDNEAEIPYHYEEIATFDTWMAIYDDKGLTQKFHADKITVYRAGGYGAIIKLVGNNGELKTWEV